MERMVWVRFLGAELIDLLTNWIKKLEEVGECFKMTLNLLVWMTCYIVMQSVKKGNVLLKKGVRVREGENSLQLALSSPYGISLIPF